MLVAPCGRLKAEPVTGPGHLFQVNKGRIPEHSRVGAEGHMERRQGAGSCQLCLEPQPPHPLTGLAQGFSRTCVPQAPSVGITSQGGSPKMVALPPSSQSDKAQSFTHQAGGMAPTHGLGFPTVYTVSQA